MKKSFEESLKELEE